MKFYKKIICLSLMLLTIFLMIVPSSAMVDCEHTNTQRTYESLSSDSHRYTDTCVDCGFTTSNTQGCSASGEGFRSEYYSKTSTTHETYVYYGCCGNLKEYRSEESCYYTIDNGTKCACGNIKQSVHTHAYNQKNTSIQYVKTHASCTSAAVYYYSCTCGERGSDTFTSGTALGHTFTTKNTSINYLKSYATCTSPAYYYYSCYCGAMGNSTFSSGTVLGHTYDQRSTDTKYLKSGSTCTSPAYYYYSCRCGASGSATFTYSSSLGHEYGDDYICIHCNMPCTHQTWVEGYCSACNKPYPTNCEHEHLSSDKFCLGCGKYIAPGSNNASGNLSYDLDYITCFNWVEGLTSYQPRAIRKNTSFYKADAAVMTRADGTLGFSGWASFSNGGLDSITVIVNFDDDDYLYFNSSSAYTNFSATLNPLKSDHINSINYNHTDITMTGDYTTNGIYEFSIDLSDYAGENFSVLIYANTVYGSDEILIAQIKGLTVYLCNCEETTVTYDPLANGKHIAYDTCLNCGKKSNATEEDCEIVDGVCFYCYSVSTDCYHVGTEKDMIVIPLEPGKHDIRTLCLECGVYTNEFLNYDCIYEDNYCIWCARDADGNIKPALDVEDETDSTNNPTNKPSIDIKLDDIDLDFISLLFPVIIILVVIAAVIPGKSKRRRRK